MGLRVEIVWASLAVLVVFSTPTEAQLQFGYYKKTCPQAEDLVKAAVNTGINYNLTLGAGLVRMHFHDCFVRGCDGSVLIDSTANNTAEKDSPINNPSLQGFQIIDNAKKKLEAVCKGVVSCADILAFAARDSVVKTGGLYYEVPAGRRDGRVSLASETFTNLPAPVFNLSQLTQSFAIKGLTQDDMVTLSGSHTIGVSHCTTFSNRLYTFNSTVSQDPSLDPSYASQLKKLCPQGSTSTTAVVPMDPRSPNGFDTSYYMNILKNRGLFTSDQTLVSSSTTRDQVKKNAANAQQWKEKFGRAMMKMGQIGVLTGRNGEIRSNCRIIN